MPNATPKFSVVVPCKGRLAAVQRTAPLFLKHWPAAEYVFVDYDCPQKSGDWILQNIPNSVVIKVTEAPLFNLSRARNIGAHQSCGDWIVFADVDILISPSFVNFVEAITVDPSVLLSFHAQSKFGTLVVYGDKFDATGGYDENFTNWGCEDTDLKNAVKRLGVQEITMDSNLVEHIEHSDTDRTRYYAEKHTQTSHLDGLAYIRNRKKRIDWLKIHLGLVPAPKDYVAPKFTVERAPHIS